MESQATLTVGLLAITLLAMGCSEKIDTPEEYALRAQVLERKGQLVEAEVTYGRAIELAADQPRLWFERGVTRARLNQLDGAIADYDRAIALDKDFARAWNNRGAAHALKQDFAAAIRDCSEAIRLEPTDHLAYRNRGLAQLDSANPGPAVQDFNRALELNSNDGHSYLGRGRAFMDLSFLDEAKADFDQAADLEPELAEVYLARAMLLARQGQMATAEKELAKARELGSPVSHINLDSVSREPTSVLDRLVRKRLEEIGLAPGATATTVRRGSIESTVVTKRLSDTGEVLFTSDEIPELREPKPRVLVVVNSLGEIVHVRENWHLQAEELKPTLFSLSLTAPEEEAEAAPAIPGQQ